MAQRPSSPGALDASTAKSGAGAGGAGGVGGGAEGSGSGPPVSPARPSHGLFDLLQRRELGPGRPSSSPGQFTKRVRGSAALVSRLALESELEWHHGCVNTISFAPSGQRLISGSDDRHIVLGDWQTGAICSRWHSGHHNNVFQAKCVPLSNERRLVSCAADGQVRVSELAEDGTATTRALLQHRGRAHKLAVDPNSPNTILSTGEDGYVQEIDLRVGHESTELVRVSRSTVRQGRPKALGLHSISLNPMDPHYFCTGGEDPICRVWDRRKLPHVPLDEDDVCQPVFELVPRHLQTGMAGRISITCAVYSHDGREIVASYNDENIYLLEASGALSETATGYLQKYVGHRNERTVKGVNFMGPASEFVVSGSDCGHIFVWNKKSAELMVMHKGDDEVVNCLEPHPHLAVLATSGIGDDVKIWAPTGEPFNNFDGAKRQAMRNARGREFPRMFFGRWPASAPTGEDEDESSSEGDDDEDGSQGDSDGDDSDSDDAEESDDQGIVFGSGRTAREERRATADRLVFFRRPTDDSSDESDRGDDSAGGDDEEGVGGVADNDAVEAGAGSRRGRSSKRQRVGQDVLVGVAGEGALRDSDRGSDQEESLVREIETLYDSAAEDDPLPSSCGGKGGEERGGAAAGEAAKAGDQGGSVAQATCSAGASASESELGRSAREGQTGRPDAADASTEP
jgi:WD repeat-containing protein 42A